MEKKALAPVNNIHKCAPKIWRKMTNVERFFWNMFYEDFLVKELMPFPVTDDEMKVIAHNMAYQAVWSFMGKK